MRNEDGSDTCHSWSYRIHRLRDACIHILHCWSDRRDERGRQAV